MGEHAINLWERAIKATTLEQLEEIEVEMMDNSISLAEFVRLHDFIEKKKSWENIR